MKYPKLRSEWVPVENPTEKGITRYDFKAYLNGELYYENSHDYWQTSAEFFIPAWDDKGKLLVEPSAVIATVQAISDNFPSEVIVSEPIQLSSIGIGNPSNLEVFVMPFPENFQDYEVPVVPNSGVI
tara:strand:+ start:130 stop:510 length:381 start_codon:yes stop_codon:yes gene_type:complete